MDINQRYALQVLPVHVARAVQPLPAYKAPIAIVVQGQVAEQREQLLDATLDRILGMVERDRYRCSRCARGQQVVIAGSTVILDPAEASFDHELERLASAIEASIAHERASAMLAAAGENGPLPLWLVTGSSLLAHWLAWSRSEAAFCRRLVLSDHTEDAPVVGSFKRSARAAIGQTAVNIRVANGLAVAGRIDLPAQWRCVLALGQTARVTIPACQLPHTIVATLAGRGMSQLGSHPFFSAAHVDIKAARVDGQALLVDLEHDWRPLAPVPEAALAAVPADADPAVPWRATRREVADLYGLVNGLRRHGRTV